MEDYIFAVRLGKALCKRKAMDHCSAIILKVGKILSFFSKKTKFKKKDKKQKIKENTSVFSFIFTVLLYFVIFCDIMYQCISGGGL